MTGCWVVFYSDLSDIRVFANEIEALRYAVDHSMSVKFLQWGQGRQELLK